MLCRFCSVLLCHILLFRPCLQRRGVDDDVALEYYPFRDDGRVIHKVISRMIKQYVNL